jgi:hypothetical protein
MADGVAARMTSATSTKPRSLCRAIQGIDRQQKGEGGGKKILREALSDRPAPFAVQNARVFL